MANDAILELEIAIGSEWCMIHWPWKMEIKISNFRIINWRNKMKCTTGSGVNLNSSGNGIISICWREPMKALELSKCMMIGSPCNIFHNKSANRVSINPSDWLSDFSQVLQHTQINREFSFAQVNEWLLLSPIIDLVMGCCNMKSEVFFLRRMVLVF